MMARFLSWSSPDHFPHPLSVLTHDEMVAACVTPVSVFHSLAMGLALLALVCEVLAAAKTSVPLRKCMPEQPFNCFFIPLVFILVVLACLTPRAGRSALPRHGTLYWLLLSSDLTIELSLAQ